MMKAMSRRAGAAAVLLGAALTSGALAYAQAPRPGAAATAAELERARAYFTNLELIDQDGNAVRFFDDVLKDKVVVINFIFTNCDGACPLMTHKLTQVRDQLEDVLGDPVWFVSLSIDPERDTPAAMKAFARTHGADHEGWIFLTGARANLEHITKKLGQYSEYVEAHSTMMLAGNVNEAHWIKIPPQDQAQQIAQKLRYLMEDDDV